MQVLTLFIVLLLPAFDLSYRIDLFPPGNDEIVPNIVHQTYDYQAPNFFLYLSFLCVQRYISPQKHILWVNNEGKYRKSHWETWINRAKAHPESWEYNLSQLISSNKIVTKFITFPIYPPNNSSIYASNKAHRSDFLRMYVLSKYGGIYLDTDAYPISSLSSLRKYNFTLSFDNVIFDSKHTVEPISTKPKRLNNGVILSSPQSRFLNLWMHEYAHYNPRSFEYDSSIVPYVLATKYPDLIHIEWNRISPISFAFQTRMLADALTCGLYVPVSPNLKSAQASDKIWSPVWDAQRKRYSFEDTSPDEYTYKEISKKLVLHLTMSGVR